MHNIKSFMSWNDFPRRLARKYRLILLYTSSSTTENPNKNVENNPNLNKIWIRLPYTGRQELELTISFIRKITPRLKSQKQVTGKQRAE